MRTLVRLEVVTYELMRRPSPIRSLIGLAIAAAVVASCGSSGSTDNVTSVTEADTTIPNPPTSAPAGTDPTTSLASSSSVPQPPIEPITLSACPGSSKVKCATLNVPYDYENPTLGSFAIPVRVRPAAKSPSAGPLFVNRGGPGAESASMATDADFFFSQKLIDSFDIVAFDPRGTGATEPHVDCVDEVDPYFAADITFDTPEERQRLIDDAQAFNDACQERSGEILPYISTVSSARDIDTLRRALGYDKISYFGFSYGSELGATWARLFPSTVRAAVFDGASDPNASYLQAGLDQAAGFERELNKFFADCATRKTCAAYNSGNPAALFDEMMRRVERDPLFVNDKRTLVTSTVAYTAVVDAMYSSALWPTLSEAIADATKKPIADGTGLLALYDDYYQRRPDGSYDNLLEAFIAISCLDDNGGETVDGVDAQIPKFEEVAPRLGKFFGIGYNCALWPAKSLTADRAPVSNIGTGPIVVVGTTGDAATPLESSRKMAAALTDGRLIIATEDQHTGYGTSECVTDRVDAYLVELEIPAKESTCT